MNGLFKIFIAVSFFFSSSRCFAQYDYMRIKLVISKPLKLNHFVEFELYKGEDKYCLKAKNESQAIDTIYVICKTKFDEMSQLALSISSTDILRGMNPDNPLIWTDATGSYLEINVFSESIRYTVLAPYADTDKRYLRTYLQLCKEIIQTARMNPKHVLSR